MALSNGRYGRQLDSGGERGAGGKLDSERHVVYIDRRLAIARDCLNSDTELRQHVAQAIRGGVTYAITLDVLSAVAARYAERHPESRVFSDMTQGGLVRAFMRALIAYRVAVYGVQGGLT